MKKGPWTITSSKTVYKNEWMEVIEDDVLRPDGKKGIFTVVHQKPGISAIPLAEDGAVFLLKEFHYALNEYTIEAVSGGIEDGETPEVTAKREMREEAGINVETLIPLGTVHPFTSAIYSPATLFLAQGLTFLEQKLEGTEHIEVIKVPLATALEWADNGTIVHAPTIVLLYRIEKYREKRSTKG